MHVKSLQLCPTLLGPMHYKPPGSSVHGSSGQEYWSGLPCPLPEDLPNPASGPCLLCPLHWQVDSLPLAQPQKP